MLQISNNTQIFKGLTIGVRTWMGKEPNVVSCGVNLELDDPKTGSLTKLEESE
jgi:hypothetical protein